MNCNFQLCNHPSLVVNDDPSSNNQDRRGGRAKKKICYAEEEKSSAAPGADVSPRRRHIFNKVLHQRFCFFARASVLIVCLTPRELPDTCPSKPWAEGRIPGSCQSCQERCSSFGASCDKCECQETVQMCDLSLSQLLSFEVSPL